MYLHCEEGDLLPFDLLHLVKIVWERNTRALWKEQGDDCCQDDQTSHEDVRQGAVISTCDQAEGPGYSETGSHPGPLFSQHSI